MNIMKKLKPSKEELLQFIFDNGVEKALIWWSLDKAELDKILNPLTGNAPKIRTYGSDDIEIDEKVSLVINKHYELLYNKFVRDKSTLSMCQTSEDVFHNTLLKVMEELSVMTEDQILEYIDYRLKMIRFNTKQDQKELYKHQTYLDNANNC